MRVLIVSATWVARAYYSVLKKLFRVTSKVVLLSRQSSRPSLDLVMLADELHRRDPSLEVVVRCRELGGSFWDRVSYVGEILAQMYELATARVCLVEGYIIPVSTLTHRPELTVVQMWHALGAIKKFGYQSVGAPGGRPSELASAMSMHRNYDVVLCGGPAAVPIFAEAFAVDPAIVKPTGLPRIDYLRAHADARARLQKPPAADLVRRFPLLADRSRRVVLYAPTFRRGGESRFGEVLERFDDERYALVVKPHLLEHVRTEGANVVDATGVSVLDLLPLCDAVITDYSAVAFEACVLDKPVYFYVYDIDRYRRDCGLNIDPLAEFGAIASRDIVDIGRLIDAETYDDTPLRRLKNGYVPEADGSCTARIADMVLDLVTAP